MSGVIVSLRCLKKFKINATPEESKQIKQLTRGDFKRLYGNDIDKARTSSISNLSILSYTNTEIEYPSIKVNMRRAKKKQSFWANWLKYLMEAIGKGDAE